MARDLRELEEELAKLNMAEKAAIARSLIDALNEKWDEDVVRLWMEEAERRYAAYRRGEVRSSLASNVFSWARERLQNKVTVGTYRKDTLYPKVVRATARILKKSEVVSPISGKEVYVD